MAVRAASVSAGEWDHPNPRAWTSYVRTPALSADTLGRRDGNGLRRGGSGVRKTSPSAATMAGGRAAPASAVPAPLARCFDDLARSHRRRTAYTVMAAAVVTGTVAWSAGWLGAGVTTAEVLDVHDVEVVVLPGPVLRVRTLVTNTSGDARSGDLRFVLAPAAARDPWAERAYASTPRHTTLAAGGETAVEWSEPVAVPAGAYRVTVFARAARDGRVVPAGEATAGDLVHADGPLAGGVWRASPASDVAVSSATLTGSPGEAMTVEAVVTNRTAAAQSFIVGWSLVEVESGRDASWWRRPSRVIGGSRVVALDAGGEEAIAFDAPWPPVPGRFLVQLRVETESGLLERVALGHALDVPVAEVGMARGAGVVGPVLVTSVATAVPGPDGAFTVSVGLANMSPVESTVRCFWLVAEPGLAEPWRASRYVADAVTVTLGPSERRAVVVPGTPTPSLLASGDLVVGVHHAADDAHSDWVRVAPGDPNGVRP